MPVSGYNGDKQYTLLLGHTGEFCLSISCCFFSDPTLGSFTHSWITCLEQAWRTEILCPATEPTAVAISETSELQLRSSVFPPKQHGHHTLPTGPGIVPP